MVMACGYKQENYCKCYRQKIEDFNNEKICDNCLNKTEIFTEKDKRRLLYQAYSDASKKKSAYDVMYMRGIYGHDSQLNDDFDSIYYDGYTLWLVVHKKYKYINGKDILDSFRNMQFMCMRIPKRVRREAKRIELMCEREKPWWH